MSYSNVQSAERVSRSARCRFLIVEVPIPFSFQFAHESLNTALVVWHVGTKESFGRKRWGRKRNEGR